MGTKENMEQSNSYRTLSRESGHSGLRHVREARFYLHFDARSSKVGTVCVSSASTGLCGGRRATAVPTATTVLTAIRSDRT
jgi:hypothetical protein